jgi:hypothetical protein
VNAQLLGFLVVPVIIVVLLWILMHQSRSAQKTMDTAQRLIENPAHDSGGEIVFHKPRATGYTLILFFVAMCCLAAYGLIYNWRSLQTAAGLQKGSFAVFLVLVALSPLIRGIKDSSYAVRISPDELIIPNRTTTRVPLLDIKDVRVRGSFCQIRLMAGEEDFKVGSDLKNFIEFVSLLCARVDAAKARSGTSTEN